MPCRRRRRREQIEELVDVRRDDVFLEEELDAVGDRLKQAPRPDAVGADPVLHLGRDLALGQDQIRDDARAPPPISAAMMRSVIQKLNSGMSVRILR